MTQEELDALLENGIDDIEEVEEETKEENEEAEEKDIKNCIKDELTDIVQECIQKEDEVIIPMPATEDHKVVGQLDDVTRDSEIKATEIFDKLETISEFLGNCEEKIETISNTLNNNIEVFEKLTNNFPNISLFSKKLEENKTAKEEIENIVNDIQASQDEVMMIMDIMQYQDIHRQKIERVINVMRALTKYMNVLFEGKIDDKNRVSSAKHIVGDSSEDIVNEEDIEALIENFGKK